MDRMGRKGEAVSETTNWECQACGEIVSGDRPCDCVERANATIDWARARLETLLAVWDRFDDEARRQVIQDIARSLDRVENPKLNGDRG